MSSGFQSEPFDFPWYDAWWLDSYELARDRLRALCPEKLEEFERSFDVLRTKESFEAQRLGTVLCERELEEMREVVRSLRRDELELHEIDQFGRLLVHDHPALEKWHLSLTEKMARLVGEAVEPSYSFLCMYHNLGACSLHLDDPSAKWTLSICLNRSLEWPFYVGDVAPWPERAGFNPDDWEERVRRSVRFRAYDMKPGEGVIFSGSSQWHYREPIRAPKSGDFCDLILFHYRPAGTKDLLDPVNWPKRFDVPDLFPAPKPVV